MSAEYRPHAFAGAEPATDAPKLRYDISWLDRRGRERWDELRLPANPITEAAVAMLAGGAMIDTPRGPVAVEDLMPGDRVTTPTGSAAVRWVGRRDHAPSGPRPTLHRVAAGAFGRDRPSGDVMLGAAAHVLLESPRCRPLVGRDAALAPVAGLVDSLSVIAVQPPGVVSTFGVACDGQEALLCDGLPVACYHPARDAMGRMTPAVLSDMTRLIPPMAEGFGAARVPYLSATEAQMLHVF